MSPGIDLSMLVDWLWYWLDVVEPYIVVVVVEVLVAVVLGALGFYLVNLGDE